MATCALCICALLPKSAVDIACAQAPAGRKRGTLFWRKVQPPRKGCAPEAGRAQRSAAAGRVPFVAGVSHRLVLHHIKPPALRKAVLHLQRARREGSGGGWRGWGAGGGRVGGTSCINDQRSGPSRADGMPRVTAAGQAAIHPASHSSRNRSRQAVHGHNR